MVEDIVNSLLSRRNESEVDFELNRIFAVLDALDNPQNKVKSLHLAGTNGKSSTAYFLSKFLVEQGYNVGMYTSPHILSVYERIKINNINIKEEDFINAYYDVIDVVEQYEAQNSDNKCNTQMFGFYEVLTIMAFNYFAKKELDFIVIETGMGGKLDATNVMTNKVASVITVIDYDHQKYLGNTLSEISEHKLGIICQTAKTFISHNNCESVIKKAINLANSLRSEIYLDYLQGSNYLEDNYYFAQYIINTIELDFNHRTEVKPLDLDNFEILGRMQIVHSDPDIMLDVAHNQQSLRRITSDIKKSGEYQYIVCILAVYNDKDFDKAYKVISDFADETIVTVNSSTRSYIPKDYLEPEVALDTALKLVKNKQNTDQNTSHGSTPNPIKSLILITGSHTTVGDFLKIIKKD